MIKRTISAIQNRAFLQHLSMKNYYNAQHIYQIDPVTLCVLQGFTSIMDASRNTNINHSSIARCCQGKQEKAGLYYWCYKQDYSNHWQPPQLSCHRNERIYCIETHEVFLNAKEASEKLGIGAGEIRGCCTQENISAQNLHFCFLKDKNSYQSRNNQCFRKVRCLNNNKVYNSTAEAARDLHLPDYKHICDCCSGKRKTSYGYSFCYEEDYQIDLIPLERTNGHKKAVICIEQHQFFKSIQDAKVIGGSKVGEVCRGHRKTANQMHWRFATEEEIQQQKYIEQPGDSN